ncbi:hypothetical protein V5O48_008841 [Marasmius crinis-equi]|uniref:BTB domain-containing protein n=1 Tax=Marasmius crinis-equi TaxID=585013 RepID=A0ABR3FCX1_9AGAR
MFDEPNLRSGGGRSQQAQAAGQYGISSTFGNNVDAGEGRPPADMILFSNDSIAFYTDEQTLLRTSTNSFNHLLPLTAETSERTLFLPEISSSELEIMLRGIHNVPSETAQASIDIQTLTRAIDHLPVYGISPSTCITPTSHLYRYLLSCAPLYPVEIYALSSQYDIVSLAMMASSHTLVVDLSQVHEDLANRMGSTYMLRLFRLHLSRVETLKKLLSVEPGLHNPTVKCDFNGQRELREMWNLAVASLSHVLKPNTTTTAIRDAIMLHTANLTCEQCIKLREARLSKIVKEWSMAPLIREQRTITM